MDKIYGRNPVIEALQSERPVERVYILDSISGEFEKQVRQLCKDRDIPLNRVPREKLDAEVPGNHQGIYALSSVISYVDLEELLSSMKKEKRNPILLLLDGVQDVRNIGAIARSAEIFGVDALVLPSKKTAPLNDVAIKASAGALTHIPVCRVRNLGAAIDLLCKNEIQIIGADLEGSESLEKMDFSGPLALVLGAEGKGIDRNLKIYFDQRFYIGQVGKTESLNVSVAAGIILYEIHKQRL
ncbi:UNVERIFIED_CONTAM: hypothetical protein GTU68_043918 [Idotea baltica]|nr:hypothetical protein [Idotea baltica]